MNRIFPLLAVVLLGTSPDGIASGDSHSRSHGIDYPEGWQEWATIAVSHRNDK